MTTATVTRADIERALVEQSFLDFLDHVWIEERLADGATAGKRKFEKWPHLLEGAGLLLAVKLLVWLKARQIGASWLVAAFVVWQCLYRPNALWVLFSQGETEAKELLRKCRFIVDNLPPHLRTAMKASNLSELEFTNGSRILALPSTQRAGRSFTATGVVMDEADFHPWFTENLEAVKPTTDAGGQLFLLSTSNYETIDSGFKITFRKAPQNGYTPVFYGWRARPGRDDAWHRDVLAQSLDLTRTQKEYPESPEEALAAPQSIRAFDVEALDWMKTEVRAPKWREGYANIWKRYIPGRKYCAFTDTSHGVGGDYATTGVMDAESADVVADILDNTLTPEALAQESVNLLKLYQNPLWGIEDNEWGILTLKTAKALGYANLYHRDNDEDKPEGWHTDDKTRPVLWGESQAAIKARHITVPNAEGLKQFYDVIKNPKKGGRIEAVEGGHDDYPIMVAGLWQMRKYAHAGPDPRSAPVPSRWAESNAGVGRRW